VPLPVFAEVRLLIPKRAADCQIASRWTGGTRPIWCGWWRATPAPRRDREHRRSARTTAAARSRRRERDAQTRHPAKLDLNRGLGATRRAIRRRRRHARGARPPAGSFLGGFRTPALGAAGSVTMGRHPKPLTVADDIAPLARALALSLTPDEFPSGSAHSVRRYADASPIELASDRSAGEPRPGPAGEDDGHSLAFLICGEMGMLVIQLALPSLKIKASGVKRRGIPPTPPPLPAGPSPRSSSPPRPTSTAFSGR
jgi:hypothetical protein